MAFPRSFRLKLWNYRSLFNSLAVTFSVLVLVHILSFLSNKQPANLATSLHSITSPLKNLVNNTITYNGLQANGVRIFHENLSEKTKIYSSMNNSIIGHRMLSRRARLQEQCRKMKLFGCSPKGTLQARYHFFYDYNTAICTIAKAASSTWKAHLRDVNKGPPNHIKIHLDARREAFLNRSLDLVLDDISHSHNIITVRHPLIRLVSAFRNKYRGGKVMKPYNKVFEDDLHKRSAVGYWDHRFLQFWLPALMANDLVPLDTHTRAGIRDPINLNTTYSLKECVKLYDILKPKVNFVQFLNFVVKTYKEGKPDAHWKQYYQTCCVCFIDYDYITKVETLTEDLQLLFKELSIPSNPEISKNQLSKTDDSINQDFRYYEKVPSYLKEKLYQHLKKDMDLFGYELPKNFWK